jgi:superkiller protein 3
VTQIHQEKEMYWVDSYNLAVASNKIAGAYSDSIKLMPTKENTSLFGEKQQKAYAAAENALKDAIAIDPSRFDSYNFLTNIYDFQGKFDQSSMIWKEADQAMPNNLNAKFGLVKSFQNQKKFPEAISVLQSIRKLKPDSSEVYNLLARTYYTMGDSANFLSMLNEMVTKFPNDKQNFKFLGQIYYQKKDYLTATEKFSRAVEIDPKDYDATYNLALMQAAVGQDLGEKIQSIENQLLKNPKNPKKLEQDVTDLNNKRKAAYNASIVALRRAIEIDPKSFDAYDLLFRCYANLGNKAEAEKALKKRDELKSR